MSKLILSSDDGMDLIAAVCSKYAAADDSDSGGISADEPIHARLELRGFDKIRAVQADVLRLQMVVLAGSQVSHIDPTKVDQKFRRCTELDLSSTRVTSWSKLLQILDSFPQLRILQLKCVCLFNNMHD